MSDKVGPINYSAEKKLPLSEEFSKLVDSEVQAVVLRVEKMTTELLTLHKKEVIFVNL
jgi:ATP-dependent Zn protease